LYVMLKKEYVEDLYRCLEENMDAAYNIINTYVPDDELSAALDEKFREMLYYLNRAYNPELVELKRRTRLYYKKWLSLKNTDKVTSNAVYLKYLKLKRKVTAMKIPF
jgi:hypothetical protein